MYPKLFLLGLFLICQLIWSGVATPPALALALPSNIAPTTNKHLVAEVWKIVNQAYLDDSFNHQNWWQIRENTLKGELDSQESTYTVIKDMLANLGDPFTRFLPPDQYRGLKVNTSGELSGVGLQIMINPETKILEVISPLEGSPAAKAGIQARDQILEINGVLSSTLTLDEAATKMRGRIGTKVKLKVQTIGQVAVEMELQRDRITLNPVYAQLDNSTGQSIGYIRLTQFSANAPKEVAHAIVDLETKGVTGYILDLRNNPGGLLQAGIDIARFWLDEATVVYTVNRQGMMGSFTSTDKALTQAPLTVLVNRGTASSSEILAGALQDNGRAQLVGETTFGKGLIQSLFDLEGGSGLAVTVAKYETPNHRDINKLGITPDRIVPSELLTFSQVATPEDDQYQAALKIVTTNTQIAKTNQLDG